METLLSTAHIGQGWVLHARPQNPKTHFRYPIFNYFLPLKETDRARTKWPLFTSVNPRHYLDGSESDLARGVFSFLKNRAEYTPDHVVLQTLPAMMGYVFNPVSFWYCFKAGALDAVLCEVNNTFGDRHFYFVQNVKGRADEASDDVHTLPKVFHVSPFFDISGRYEFVFRLTERTSDATIRYLGDDQKLRLNTRIFLTLEPLHQVPSWRIWLRYGWMTPLVMLKIHWQALKLWVQKTPFHGRPQPPTGNLTT